MNAVLPDISQSEEALIQSSLEWVGMQGIDLPVTLAEPDCPHDLHARVDAHVNLPARRAKGIHMSRLYRLLENWSLDQALTPGTLRQLMQAMVDSHHDCESDSARLRLGFNLLTRRPALVTPELSGWKSYPVDLEATHVRGVFRLQATVSVGYSSTCPCSAALARQLIEQGFMSTFGGHHQLTPATVASWLRQQATLATPHSQRSEARITVDIPPEAPALGLLPLIDRTEQALGTPLQTAVKRADEQAFAALNGQNLMFVEDAARRIRASLKDEYAKPRVHVRHVESLHPHDAVAWAGANRDAVFP